MRACVRGAVWAPQVGSFVGLGEVVCVEPPLGRPSLERGEAWGAPVHDSDSCLYMESWTGVSQTGQDSGQVIDAFLASVPTLSSLGCIRE